jgi:hypothetical protein
MPHLILLSSLEVEESKTSLQLEGCAKADQIFCLIYSEYKIWQVVIEYGSLVICIAQIIYGSYSRNIEIHQSSGNIKIKDILQNKIAFLFIFD